MKASEREYRNIGIGINIFSYGITNHLSTAVGLVTILPYADIKYSMDFGKYVHMSIGGYAFIPFAFGVHGSVSIGTPDYFLNLSYLRNDDVESFYTDSDFESFGIGASFRVGPRSRVLAEFNIMTSPSSMYGYDAFYEYGYGDSFSWGYGWFGRKMRFETGLMAIGPIYNYNCFPEPCGNRYHVPIPFIAFGINF